MLAEVIAILALLLLYIFVITFCLGHIFQIINYQAPSCLFTNAVKYTILEIREYFISLSKHDSLISSHMINWKRMLIYYVWLEETANN